MKQEEYTSAFEWLLNDRYRVLYHLLFWLFFYADTVIYGFFPGFEFFPKSNFVLFLGDFISVYFSLYVLIPQFLLKNKFRLFILSELVLILIVSLVNYFIDHAVYFEIFGEELELYPSDVANAIIFQTSVLGTAVGINIFKRFLRNRVVIKQLETTNLQTELAYLKEQINPHFLFNALNSIYVQTRKRPAEASESILLLSDLLRYQLYDCVKEKIYLTGEIDYLKNYLKLDKLRKSKAEIDFEVNGNTNGKMVAPFIFLPFVENAIKHGLSIENESFIKIKFDLKDDKIIFTVKNSKPEKATQKLGGGIGLNNVKRRLELLYPDKHEFSIKEEKLTFEIILKLEI